MSQELQREIIGINLKS